MTGFRWWLAAALAALPFQLAAQAVVRGRVRADSGGAAIPFAMVELPGAGRAVQANLSGGYRLDSVPAGPHRLRARAVGYRPFEVAVELAPGDTLELDLRLARSAVELAPIVVSAARPVSGKLAAFAARRQRGLGRFYDRAELARLPEGSMLSRVLRQTTGVRLVQLQYPCSGSAAATGRSGGATAVPPGMICSLSGELLRPACYLTVFLDGIRIWKWGDPDPPDVERIGLHDVEAVEIYRGPAEVPVDLQAAGSDCGALVLWSRVGGTP